MKIYTKTGDDGTTSLIGGSRVLKSDLRIDCYGTVGELNAAVGVAAATAGVPSPELAAMLCHIQYELFVIAANIATPHDSPHRPSVPFLEASAVARLESEIDQAALHLPHVKPPILPGGTELAARLYLARAVCRRAERLVVSFSNQQPLAPLFLMYMNRLSDWLQVQARHANQLAGAADVVWKKG